LNCTEKEEKRARVEGNQKDHKRVTPSHSKLGKNLNKRTMLPSPRLPYDCTTVHYTDKGDIKQIVLMSWDAGEEKK
jgi:hypothetical protein